MKCCILIRFLGISVITIGNIIRPHRQLSAGADSQKNDVRVYKQSLCLAVKDNFECEQKQFRWFLRNTNIFLIIFSGHLTGI